MFFEHWIYSTAIAIIIGMIYFRSFRRDLSWIIIASAYIPDIDVIAYPLLKKIGIIVLVNGHPIEHGNFHNIAILILYALSVAFLLHPLGIKFIDSLFFAGIGFAAHLFEDALVFDPAYPFFWPITTQSFGIGLFNYTKDFYRIANKEVLIVGLILVGLSAMLRTAYEGTGWVAMYLPLNGHTLSRKNQLSNGKKL